METAEFNPTHTIDGIPVIRVVPEKGWPRWYAQDGSEKRVSRGHPATKITDQVVTPSVEEGPKEEEEIEEISAVLPAVPIVSTVGTSSPKVVATTTIEKVSDEPIVSRNGYVRLPMDAVYAIFRSVAYPSRGDAVGFAETVGGTSATLLRPLPDGSLRIRINSVEKDGDKVISKWYVVRVPEFVQFEIVEAD